jgi:hypothetical protein
MAATYKHHMWTGSGWREVILVFTDNDTAIVEYDGRSMGNNPLRYRSRWHHDKFSDSYGLLRLRALERYISLDSDATTTVDLATIVLDADTPDELHPLYTDISFEYIRLPHSEVWIADDPGLEEMRAMGYARWNDTFDLITFFHFSAAYLEGKLEGTDLGNLISGLDKTKFAVVSPE